MFGYRNFQVTPKQRDYPSAFLLIFLAFLVVFWFREIIFADKIFCFGDLPRYFYPLRRFGAEAIKSGTIPLWNPYLYCGFPYLATLQSAVFYPLSIIGYLLPSFDPAFNYFIVIHFFLGGTFVFLLMRHWGVRRSAGLISALTFTFSGYLCSVVHMNTSLSSVIWLPLVILFFDRTISESRPSCLLLTGIFLGIQFLGGEPTVLYGTVWVLFFYCFTRLSPAAGGKVEPRGLTPSRRQDPSFGARANFREFGRSLLFLAGAVAFAAGLTFAQILPFAELLRHSHRAAGGSFEQISNWSLPPFELINFLVPFSLGNITLPGGYWGPQQWLVSNYLGILPLILAGVGMIFRPRKETTFFALIFFGSLLLALGRYTPVYRLLYHWVPGFNYIRYPVKYLFLTTFALSVLAGFGYEKIGRETEKAGPSPLPGRILLGLNLVVGVILVSAYRFRNPIFSWIIKYYFAEGIYEWQVRRLASIFINDIATLRQTLFFFTAGTLLIFFLLNKKLSPAAGKFLAPAVILVDLAVAHWGINMAVDRNLFHYKTATIRMLEEDRGFFRIFRSPAVIRINTSVYGRDYGRGLIERKETFTANTMMLYRFFDAYGYGSLQEKNNRRLMVEVGEHPPLESAAVLSMLNIKYLATRSPIAAEGFRTLKSTPVALGEVWISGNENCLPRAFLVKRAAVIKDREEILSRLFSGEFNPAEEVIVEKEPPSAFGGAGGSGDEKAAGSVEIITYGLQEIVLKAYLPEPAFLVLSENYYPGWKVFVDGRPGQIYRADYVLKAVPLEAGRHRVRFVYSPFSYRLGLAVSLFTIAGTVSFVGYRGWRRVRKPVEFYP